MNRSLRLTLLYSALFSLLFVLFRLLLYGVFSHSLNARLDDTLASEVDTAASLFADEYHETGENAEIAAREVVADMKLHGDLVAVSQGDRVLASTAQVSSGGLAGSRRRVAECRVELAGITYRVTIAASLEPIRSRNWLWSAAHCHRSAAGPRAGGIGAWLLATRALRPLASMAEQARRITESSLDTRIHVRDAAAELEIAIASFNDLLSRLDRSFDTMRRFVADASHELRTPISVIRGEADVALSRSVFSSNGRLNVIPTSRLNPATMKLLALVPRPNQPGDTVNYFNLGTQRFNRNNVDGKVNWNRNAKHQVWVKYSIMEALVHGDFGLGAAGGSCLCDGGVGDGHTRTQIAAIGQTYTVSPNFLVDGTLGWTRFGQYVKSPDLGSDFGSDTLGIPGTNGADPRESGMPAFSPGSDYSTLGNTEGWNPAFRNDQSYTLNGNASWMNGAHEIRFGFDFMHHLMNHWQPELGSGPRGSFSFGNGVTALNPAAIASSVGFQGGAPSFENGWNGLAGFLLGTPTSSGKSPQNIKMDSLENQFALYVRDRWRVTSRLTLNLGLRWELYPNRTRSAGLGIESYDPTTNEVLVGGRGSIPQDAGVGYSKKLFAPRVGFAYELGNSTVVRSGYGITYHSHPWGAQALRGWYPFTIVAVYSGVNGYQPVTTDPNYVAAGVPNRPLGNGVGIPPIVSPDISKGRIPLPLSNEMGYPVANQQMTRGYIQFLELHRRAQAAGRAGNVGRICRDGIGERLCVSGHQCLTTCGFGQRRAPAICEIRAHRDNPRVERPHAQQLPLSASHNQPAGRRRTFP